MTTQGLLWWKSANGAKITSACAPKHTISNSPMVVQKWEWASKVFMQRLFRRSQTRRVLSSLAEVRYLPPGWNARPRTQLSWPIRVNMHSPVPTSHTWWHRSAHYSKYWKKDRSEVYERLLSSKKIRNNNSEVKIHFWFQNEISLTRFIFSI